MRVTTEVTLRAFGVVATFATASLWAQLSGLFGSQGIAPIAETMESLHSGNVSFWSTPTLLWLGHSDFALHGLAALCVVASVCMAAGLAPRWASALLFVCWLSLVQVAAPFLNFQWDILLVETSLLMAMLAPAGLRPFHASTFSEPRWPIRFALAVLACKVTLGSGIVKLISGDQSWRDLTALTYHWWSQPLPTWTSVIANEWPLGIQKLLCAVMFVLEVPIPLLALGPRPARIISAVGLAAMQLGLLAAGNYSYFNALTLVLSLPLLDDAALAKVVKSFSPGPSASPVARSPWLVLGWLLAASYAFFSVTSFSRRFVFDPPLETVRTKLAPFHLVNAYGAFAVMTKTRAEIILEGSDDGVTWSAYEFPWKPGRLERRPDFVAPWQPRLDWQMWFASLGTCESNPWFLAFQWKVLKGEPSVLALLEATPFPAAPPKYLRSTSYEYRFAPLGTPGVWWTRSLTGPYCPPLALAPNGQLRRAQELER